MWEWIDFWMECLVIKKIGEGKFDFFDFCLVKVDYFFLYDFS